MLKVGVRFYPSTFMDLYVFASRSFFSKVKILPIFFLNIFSVVPELRTGAIKSKTPSRKGLNNHTIKYLHKKDQARTFTYRGAFLCLYSSTVQCCTVYSLHRCGLFAKQVQLVCDHWQGLQEGLDF